MFKEGGKMPHIQHNGKNIYYEVHGNGQPLVILNGIMMSTLSWAMFLPELIKENQVILLDFFDQGASDKLDSSYDHATQVGVVEAVVNYLRLEKVNLFGISYGGQIAMHFAIKNKHLVDKLLLFNTTSYTNPWLKEIGNSWKKAAALRDKELFYQVTIPIIYSPEFYTKNVQWMEDRKDFLYQVFADEFLDGIIRLIDSAESHDIRAKLKELDGIKVLIVGSEYDFITPDQDQQYIHDEISSSEFIVIKGCGHASMYEKPIQFLTLVKGFIVNSM